MVGALTADWSIGEKISSYFIIVIVVSLFGWLFVPSFISIPQEERFVQPWMPSGAIVLREGKVEENGAFLKVTLNNITDFQKKVSGNEVVVKISNPGTHGYSWVQYYYHDKERDIVYKHRTIISPPPTTFLQDFVAMQWTVTRYGDSGVIYYKAGISTYVFVLILVAAGMISLGILSTFKESRKKRKEHNI